MGGAIIRYWQRVVKEGSDLIIYASETGLDWTEIGRVPGLQGDFDIKWAIEIEEPDAQFGFDMDDGEITDIKLGDDHDE